MKKFFFIGFLTVFLVPGLRLYAQNVSYTYDNAGNRTSRGVNALRSSSEEASSLETLLDIQQEIKVHPNPTGGILMVELPGLSETVHGDIRIVDLSGRTVQSSKSISRQNTFDLSGQANGIYLLRITLNDETKTWKIIKQ